MSEAQTTLGHIAPGARAVVRQLAGGQAFASRLAALGFTLGAEVVMLQNFGRGPLIVLIRDTRLALGRGEAGRVVVEPVTNGA